MSAHEAVAALRELGLSNYEARVFVALHQLGDGTARAVSRVSEVPRSQVYGAAADLADRGLVEVVEASPKLYRPVALDTARRQLRERVERHHERAFENLAAVRGRQDDHADEAAVATLRGRRPIRDRTTDLAATAEDRVLLVGARTEAVDEDLARALRDRAEAGVAVVVVTDDPELAERFDAAPVRTVVSAASGEGGYVGRTLLVDAATVLLAVPTDGDHPEPFEEVALWTAGTSIGRILARFVGAGMEAGLDEDAMPGT